MRPAQLPALPSRRLEGFGAVFRRHFNEDNVLKQGPAGYRFHRTEGSLLLFADGRPILYDGGEAGETWRHSTLSFHDADMPLAPGHVERFHDFPGLGFVQGVHPEAVKPGEPACLNDSAHHALVEVAYARFAEPNPVDVRSVFVVEDEYVILHDDLHLDPSIPCRWHLQVVSDGFTGDTAAGYRFAGRFGVDLQVLLPGQSFLEAKVERLAIQDYEIMPATPREDGGYLARGYKAKRQRPDETSFAMQHLSVRADRPRGYLAVLRPLSPGRKPVQAASVRAEDRHVGVAVTGDGIRDQLFFSRQEETFTSGPIRFRGRYGAVVERGETTRLSLLLGKSLEAAGLRIVSNAGDQAGREPAVHVTASPAGIAVVAEGHGTVEITGCGSPIHLHLTGERLTLNHSRT